MRGISDISHKSPYIEVDPFTYCMKTITILAIIAILAGATVAATGSTFTPVLAQDNATTGAGNMTGGNMTGGNMTEMIGSISGSGKSCNELC